MRIVLLTHYYPPEVGAAPRRIRSFVRRWRSAGADVHVIAPLPHYPQGHLLKGYRWRDALHTEHGDYGETVLRVPFFPTAGGGLMKLVDQGVVGAMSVPPAVLGHRPDVVVATIPGLPTLVPALAAQRRWNAPLVLDMRDSWPDLIDQAQLGPAFLRKPLSSAVSAAQRSAQAVVTVSRGFREQLARRGVNPARIHHIPNGTNLTVVPQLPPRPPGRRLRVLYLGTHGVSQGLDAVVRAIAEAGEDCVEARFIGHGTEKEALMHLARSLHAPITFHEPVTGDALWEEYAWAETCLVPLRAWPAFRDAIPSKLFEIAASGRHVTAAMEGEGAEILQASGAGVSVGPEDSGALAAVFRRLQADRALTVVGGGARQWVTEHGDEDALADRYLELLREVVGSVPTRSPLRQTPETRGRC